MDSKNTTFSADGAWCFFADPRALYFSGKHRRTYVGWITTMGNVMLGYYDHDNNEVKEIMVEEKLQKNDHANPSLYIDKAGYITIFYSAHNGKEMFYRTTTETEKIESLGERNGLPTNTEGHKGYTYPTPIYLKKENKLYLFWRGGNFKPNFSIAADLSKNEWSPARTLIADQGHRPYVRYASNHEDTIHFAFTDGHPHAEPTNSIYHAYYRNGSFYRTDGNRIKGVNDHPLTMAEAGLVYDGKATSRRSWVWDIAIDESGNPVIVYAVFFAKTDHRYYYSRFDGRTWITNEITAAGSWFPQTPIGESETEPYYSAGITLDHHNPDHVYLSRNVSGQYRIEHWRTDNLGRTWLSTLLSSSSSKLLVRPFNNRSLFTPNWPGVLLWMKGDYVQYTDYNTSLEMHIEPTVY